MIKYIIFILIIFILLIVYNIDTSVEIVKSSTLKINPYGNIQFHVYPTKHWPEFWNRVNHRIWEPELFQTIAKYVNKNVTYIDFGTWIGPTLLFGCKIAKNCYGLEPDPVAFKEVSENINLNNNMNVKVLNNCVSKKTGPMVMYSKSLGNSESSLVFKNSHNWTVDCFTMSYLYNFWNIKDNVFMKIDIEGAEYELLNSWYQWIQTLPFKPMLYISLHKQNEKIIIESLYNRIERRDNILFLIE